MTKIKCPRCMKSFHAVAPKEVRYCPYCSYGGFRVDKVLVDGKQVWPKKEVYDD